MLSKILLALSLVTLTAGTSFAALAKKPAKKPAPQVVDVKTCPVTEDKVEGKGSGTRVVGNYRVHFCCPGCDKAWDKWPKEKQLATAKRLAAKEAAAKKAKR